MGPLDAVIDEIVREFAVASLHYTLLTNSLASIKAARDHTEITGDPLADPTRCITLC